MLTEGDTVPDAPLIDADGASFTLDRYRGKPVVVYFYPKADTPGCTTEAQDFTALAPDFSGLAVPVVAISRDPVKKIAKFRDKYGLSVTLASDEGGAFSDAFGTWVEKSMYGRSYMGLERSTFLVDGDGRIVRAWPKVKVKGHAAEVLEAVRAL